MGLIKWGDVLVGWLVGVCPLLCVYGKILIAARCGERQVDVKKQEQLARSLCADDNKN
jgi:hypothetical protein